MIDNEETKREIESLINDLKIIEHREKNNALEKIHKRNTKRAFGIAKEDEQKINRPY